MNNLLEKFGRIADIIGNSAQIWSLPLPAKPNATIATYCLYAPSSHPIWPWKILAACHLRDAEGVPPALKTYALAQYELQLIPLDPTVEINSPNGPFSYLTPCDVVFQFHGLVDAQVRTMMRGVAYKVASGVLIPDSDYRTHWKDVLTQTVAEMTPDWKSN